MSSGERTKRVWLENPTTVPDGEGGSTETWVALTPPQMFAHIQPATQADLERAAAGTVLSTATHVIEMAYHPGVTVQTRIRYPRFGKPERTFQVTAVRNPDEADRELIVVAEEQV